MFKIRTSGIMALHNFLNFTSLPSFFVSCLLPIHSLYQLGQSDFPLLLLPSLYFVSVAFSKSSFLISAVLFFLYKYQFYCSHIFHKISLLLSSIVSICQGNHIDAASCLFFICEEIFPNSLPYFFNPMSWMDIGNHCSPQFHFLYSENCQIVLVKIL